MCVHVCMSVEVRRQPYVVPKEIATLWLLFWIVFAVLGIDLMTSCMLARALLLSYSSSPHFVFWNRVSHWPAACQICYTGWPISPRDLCVSGAGITSSNLVCFNVGSENSTPHACDVNILWADHLHGPQKSELPNQSDVLSYIPCDGYSGLASSTYNLSSCLKGRNSNNDLYFWESLWFICHAIQFYKKKKTETRERGHACSFQYFGNFFLAAISNSLFGAS